MRDKKIRKKNMKAASTKKQGVSYPSNSNSRPLPPYASTGNSAFTPILGVPCLDASADACPFLSGLFSLLCLSAGGTPGPLGTGNAFIWLDGVPGAVPPPLPPPADDTVSRRIIAPSGRCCCCCCGEAGSG